MQHDFFRTPCELRLCERKNWKALEINKINLNRHIGSRRLNPI